MNVEELRQRRRRSYSFKGDIKMKKFIHNIRRQPEHVRRNILHILTATCAIILVLLWIYSLGTTLENPDTQVKIGQDIKPFSAIKDNIVNGYNDMSQPNTNTNTDSSNTDPNSDLRNQENNL